MKKILCGADQLEARTDLFMHRRIGLVTNPSGMRCDYVSTADWFARNTALAALYAPEHGVRGDAQDGQSIRSYTDRRTGALVYSIYGETRRPLPEMLSGIDLLVYDIQDVGSRYYTFIYTMANCMEAAAHSGIPFVVLDRPNPLGGLQVCGTHLRGDCRSFVGMYDIPQQYGLTCGELAGHFNRTQRFGCELTVVPLQNWQRGDFGCELALPQISPSPNLPSFESILLYNGTCLFEGTNVSEGRGTTKPFQFVGAPFIDAEAYAQKLNRLALPGVFFRPAYFTPVCSKHSGSLCCGVQIHLTDYRAVRPLYVGAAMIVTLREMYPEQLRFVPPNHEKGDFTLDLLWGSDALRTQLFTPEQVFAVLDQSAPEMRRMMEDSFLY